MFKDKTAIVGIGETTFAKNLEESEFQLACRAIKAALDDAGIAPGEVDALSCYTYEETPEFEVARSVGMGDVHYLSQSPHGGGAGCGAIGHLALSIAAGIANVGVVWRSRKRGSPTKRLWAGVNSVVTDHWKWTRPQGLVRPVDEVAVLTRRYMHEYGLKREELAEVALAMRKFARNNPKALMHARALTLDQYMEARMISDPLCLFDNCLESDGAIALVLTRSDRATDCAKPPVYIHAFSQGMTAQHQLMTDYHSADPLRSSSWACAENLWRQSDIGPADIDVAQLYDAFAPLVLFSLEAYGFCGRGEAGAFAAEGNLRAGGKLPVNTSGGSLSEIYLHGMNLATEAVKQLRGDALTQIEGASTCLVTSCDTTPNGALVLRN
ncbi:lipid-transfer protein [Croceicoccus estronivorus]|uniref:thiolase C-terminal domain-containing protein n=1 Tax=Croceicoccus estronivorus TaxID=1172626 RepID=UPI000835E97C|nr:lipid-transfer protein [Croceicoccus estronivorus]OCC25611.1 lipid-transfer protein [Croceicoccus estronivorus]